MWCFYPVAELPVDCLFLEKRSAASLSKKKPPILPELSCTPNVYIISQLCFMLHSNTRSDQQLFANHLFLEKRWSLVMKTHIPESAVVSLSIAQFPETWHRYQKRLPPKKSGYSCFLNHSNLTLVLQIYSGWTFLFTSWWVQQLNDSIRFWYPWSSHRSDPLRWIAPIRPEQMNITSRL